MQIIEEKYEQLFSFLELLIKWNEKKNLVSFHSISELIIDHVLDSLSILETAGGEAKRWADIGTGAGFPGIILAIFLPQNRYIFFEPNHKYYMFLKRVILELNLKNIELINQRIEEYKKEDIFDIITSRAVGSINLIYKICKKHCNNNTRIYSFKGERYFEEIAELNFNILSLILLKKGKILEMHNKNHYIIAVKEQYYFT